MRLKETFQHLRIQLGLALRLLAQHQPVERACADANCSVGADTVGFDMAIAKRTAEGDRIFVMGGEGSSGVFAQVEAYDPVTNKWESFASMPTPRHGMGAVVIGDTVYVAGSGSVTGGSLMTSTNEAFTLASKLSQK